MSDIGTRCEGRKDQPFGSHARAFLTTWKSCRSSKELIKIYYLYDSKIAISKSSSVEALIRSATQRASEDREKIFEISKEKQPPYLMIRFCSLLGVVTCKHENEDARLKEIFDEMSGKLKSAVALEKPKAKVDKLQAETDAARAAYFGYSAPYRQSAELLDYLKGGSYGKRGDL